MRSVCVAPVQLYYEQEPKKRDTTYSLTAHLGAWPWVGSCRATQNHLDERLWVEVTLFASDHPRFSGNSVWKKVPVGLFHPLQHAGCSENIYRLNGSGGVDSGVQPNLYRE